MDKEVMGLQWNCHNNGNEGEVSVVNNLPLDLRGRNT